jgi:hypothetical protein
MDEMISPRFQVQSRGTRLPSGTRTLAVLPIRTLPRLGLSHKSTCSADVDRPSSLASARCRHRLAAWRRSAGSRHGHVGAAVMPSIDCAGPSGVLTRRVGRRIAGVCSSPISFRLARRRTQVPSGLAPAMASAASLGR